MDLDLGAEGGDGLFEVNQVGEDRAGQERVVAMNTPRAHGRSAASLTPRRPRATSTRTAALGMPAISAASIARRETPRTSAVTGASSTPASSRTLWRRFASRVRS